MKNATEIKVKVEFTEGYEKRFTQACLKQLELRKKRQQNAPPGAGSEGQQAETDRKGIA